MFIVCFTSITIPFKYIRLNGVFCSTHSVITQEFSFNYSSACVFPFKTHQTNRRRWRLMPKATSQRILPSLSLFISQMLFFENAFLFLMKVKTWWHNKRTSDCPFISFLLPADASPVGAVTGCWVDRDVGHHGGRGSGHIAGVAADGTGGWAGYAAHRPGAAVHAFAHVGQRWPLLRNVSLNADVVPWLMFVLCNSNVC